MNEYSILIGGKAGDGIDKASLVIANILNKLGYYLYIYREYPSLIRGGHTYSIIRASKKQIFTHSNQVDVLLALNKETYETHLSRLKPNSVVIHDSKIVEAPDSANKNNFAVDIAEIIAKEEAPPVTSNSILIGALVKVLGIDWDVLEKVFRTKLPKATDKNLAVARDGFNNVKECFKVEDLGNEGLPILTGNEALGLGLVKGGLHTYIAYPMTPTSTVLTFLAQNAENFNLKVLHPESEIGVILMALGCSYTGENVAVGTSGGGFCLMTEGYSFSAMAELPLVVILGQRPGPSTGLPTYSSQTELHFALNAGQGEFSRFVVAPGDNEESYFWAQMSVALAAKYKIPTIILTDKNLGEGTFSFDVNAQDLASVIKLPANETKKVYKINSYEHDEDGITTEESEITKAMQDKRLAKIKALAAEIDKYELVGIYGKKDSKTAILCWGSNKGVCIEAADSLGLKVIQPKVMSPFPVEQFKKALDGVEELFAVENNATAQLAKLIKEHGFKTDKYILKYDGRAFSIDELQGELTAIIKGQKNAS